MDCYISRFNTVSGSRYDVVFLSDQHRYHAQPATIPEIAAEIQKTGQFYNIERIAIHPTGSPDTIPATTPPGGLELEILEAICDGLDIPILIPNQFFELCA